MHETVEACTPNVNVVNVTGLLKQYVFIYKLIIVYIVFLVFSTLLFNTKQLDASEVCANKLLFVIFCVFLPFQCMLIYITLVSEITIVLSEFGVLGYTQECKQVNEFTFFFATFLF